MKPDFTWQVSLRAGTNGEVPGAGAGAFGVVVGALCRLVLA